MKINNPLDNILDNCIKTKILRFLCKTNVEWNGRQIAQEIKVSPASCHKALKELNNEKLLLFRNVGKNYLYCINKNNIIISHLLDPLYKAEREIPRTLYNIIKGGITARVKKKVVSLAVFGSVGRKEEGAESDIDILIILRHAESRRFVAKEFEKINGKILFKFGNTVSPYLKTVKEFKGGCKNKSSLLNGILESHKLLLGRPLRELL